MEFIKRMRKREFIEMGLKALIGVLIGIIVIFFMEAMIYNIWMKAIDANSKDSGTVGQAVYYLDKNDDNTYNVYRNYKDSGSWAHFTWEKSTIDEKYFEGGEMYNYNANLYKVEVYETAGDTLVNTYVYDSVLQNGTPLYQTKTAWANNDELDNHTFTIYVRPATDPATEWSTIDTASHEGLTYEEFLDLFKDPGEFVLYPSIKVIDGRKPNCFDIYMNWKHYLVMTLFLLVILGAFGWRASLIYKEYKKIVSRFRKTGKVF